MKGCLKLPSPIPSPALPDCPLSRKCVAFEAEGSEQIFFADEWDRTPTEPTRRLSYQDLMELKEIQCSLPLANQPPDPISGRPGRHYLSNVPISLLPLLPSSDNGDQCHGYRNGNGASVVNGTHGPHSDGNGSPNHDGHRGVPGYHGTIHGQGLHGFSARTAPHRNLIAAAKKVRPTPPNHLAMPTPRTTNNYLQISSPLAQHRRTNFAFLPLLDTPPSSAESSVSSSQSTTPSPSNPSSRCTSPALTSDTDHTDPPTPSLTNASLDSPVSCASSLVSGSPEPTFLQLPPKHLACLNYGNGATNTVDPHFGPIDSYFPAQTGDVGIGDHISSHCRTQFGMSSLRPSGDLKECKTSTSSKLVRKKNIILVNGVEIEMDEDEEEEAKPTPVPPSLSPMESKKNVIIVNGVEIELEGEEDKEEVSTPAQCCSLSPSDDALSIQCNSTENLKPPENKSKHEINADSSSSSRPVSSSLSTLPCTSSVCTTGDNSTMASSIGLGLELDSGVVFGERIGTKPTIDVNVGLARETSTGSRTGPRATGRFCSTAAGADATGFGLLHMPLRFKRDPAKVNPQDVSTGAVISPSICCRQH